MVVCPPRGDSSTFGPLHQQEPQKQGLGFGGQVGVPVRGQGCPRMGVSGEQEGEPL